MSPQLVPYQACLCRWSIKCFVLQFHQSRKWVWCKHFKGTWF